MKKLSVITVCLNSKDTIRACLDSRRRLLGSAVCHIIQDGGSVDGTLKIIDARNNDVLDVVSELDEGIYDAFNKAITRCKTDWLMFLHSDDQMICPSVLEDICRAESEGFAAISYGVKFVDRFGRVFRRWPVKDYRKESFRYGFMFPHTGLVVRRDLFDRFGYFRLDLGSAGDYEWILRVFFKEGELPMMMAGKYLVEMRSGGASDTSFKSRLKANESDLRAWRVLGITPSPFFRVLKPLRKMLQFA